MYGRPYNGKEVVKQWGEDLVEEIFGLEKNPKDLLFGIMPDLYAKDASFFVEVKTSESTNGGVIKEKQHNRYSEVFNMRRFYAFPYHSIKNMHARFATEHGLRRALKMKSVYLFPFSIVDAYFRNTKHVRPKNFEPFVQIDEWTAREIAAKERSVWRKMRLNELDYKVCTPHDKICIVTRRGDLEREILSSMPDRYKSLLLSDIAFSGQVSWQQ